jgi:hypothetical protein
VGSVLFSFGQVGRVANIVAIIPDRETGEHFRCHWYIPPATIDPTTKEPIVRAHLHDPDAKDDPVLLPASTESSVHGTPVMGATDSSDTM